MIDWIDWEVITTPGFVILAVGAWAATILGWIWTRKSEDMAAFSIPTLLIVLAVELAAAYYFASKG